MGGRNKYLVGLLTAVLMLSSCKKDKFDVPESNDPVFVVNGTIDNEAFQLVAGDAGAYMFTGTMDINNVDFFYGNLNDGNISIELGIFDGMIDMPFVDPENELPNVTPVFASQSTQPLVILSKFMMNNPQNIGQIKWYLNGTFVDFNEIEIYEPGWYDVMAEVTFTNGSTVQLENDIIVGYERTHNFDLVFGWDPFNNTLTASADMIGNPSGSFQDVTWTFNGNIISYSPSLPQFEVSTDGILTAEVTFAGTNVTRTKSIYVSPGSMNTVDDLTEFEEMASNNLYQDFNMRLNVIKGGVLYSSVPADNSNATIAITSFEYYGKNANNNDVYKVSANINAMVKSVVNGNQLPISFTTTFGVEIP